MTVFLQFESKIWAHLVVEFMASMLILLLIFLHLIDVCEEFTDFFGSCVWKCMGKQVNSILPMQSVNHLDFSVHASNDAQSRSVIPQIYYASKFRVNVALSYPTDLSHIKV